MTSRAARVAVLPVALSLLALSAPAAQAQRLAIDDPAGDASGGKLDITKVSVANRDLRVVARVTLAEMEKGDVIVSVDRRRGPGLRLVATKSRDGDVTGRVLPGAFTDRGAIEDPTCRRVRVTWDVDASLVRLGLPSRCWNGGDYGAVRYAVLTEARAGDSDWAPQTDDGDIGTSAWVARG